ncbi:LOB domain-containing protein 21-like [Momordica charantia]|uniref:LOB domain-containing protein 21-like n=1 Tax=Momordica charantia TaxID=3673 RepID=A0A6J1BVX5_MOMCH|nr:LOB domain-containing protein 21-like [Momordica charantia]
MRGCHETRSSSSCAACKLLKRRCTATCIFAPYFRSDEPKKFAKVHKVFGASNVSKILTEVPEEQREDTVNSLAYEAEARLRDPVYGCIGAIALLQTKMVELQHDLALARARLARYANNSNTNNNSCSSSASCSSSGVLDDCVVNMSYGGFSIAGQSQSSSEITQLGYLCDFTHFPYPFKA